MGRHARLRARISIVVATGAIVVAAGVALLLSNTTTLRSSADATLRSDAYVAAVTNVERLVIDVETGLRGYVITGRPLFLAPLRSSAPQLPAALTTVQRDAARDGSFVAEAQQLVAAVHLYLTSYVPPLLAMTAHDPRAARSFAVTLDGKQLVDSVRTHAADLINLVSARETERQRAAHRVANHSVETAIVVLVLLTLLTLALGALLGRLLIGRELARERSERTAHTLQRSLLPEEIPSIPGCELAARFTPAGAGDLVGGDFYDVFAVASGRWAIVLGDVCGKGAEAAAVTAMARWTLRSLAGAPVSPADALRFLNEAMLRNSLGGRFITIAYLLLEVGEDSVDVSIACAGHPPPILVPAAGGPVAVGARGTILGIWPDIGLTSAEVQLSPGDSLIAYTDGVTDQGPGITSASLGEALYDRAPTAGAEELADLLERYAHRSRTEPRDDIAILALQFTAGRDDLESERDEPGPEQERTDRAGQARGLTNVSGRSVPSRGLAGRLTAPHNAVSWARDLGPSGRRVPHGVSRPPETRHR